MLFESLFSSEIFFGSLSSVTSDAIPFLKLLIPLTTDGFLSHFNLQKLSDLPTVDELGAAGLIDSTSVDNAIFGSSKFFKEKQDEKKEDIYSNIDEMLNSTLDENEKDT